ncbi:MAG TPA: asparagine synthase-related protein [Candidatus Dormibacteraeota bacterium]|jgi:asparagine synthase (glutamine-hydrolysing)|nr:asparagine synthase-related protein [Candidatus Dormibacteraeota bacterium]
MPGIVGLITKMPRERAEAELLRMVEALRHESFYMTGTWINEPLGVYVGWVARKGSFSDTMPLQNEQKNVCLIFSGEEFPDPASVQTLKDRGHEFKMGGPSYLVHLYEEDSSFPANLNGRFQALLTDEKRATATLFNDRYGLHRIYYHESKEAFYFSAEAKAILAICPELRSVDPKSLGEFISCGCVLENRTLFEGIHVLPPASAWEFQSGALRKKDTYFQSKDWENQEPLEPEAYYEELRTVFSRNLPRYLNGKLPVGISLTGGLDTRMIMAWQKASPNTLPCYTFGGSYRDCQDVLLAREIAEMCGQSHQVIPVGEEFLSRFPYYAERAVYLADGCVGVSRACDLYINEYAAKIAPVRMTGNYGSEVLRRLRAFKPVMPHAGLFNSDLHTQIQSASETYSQILQGHAVTFVAFRQLPWHHFGNLALEETQVTMRSPFVDNDLVRTAFRAPDSGTVKSDIFVDNDDCIRLIGDGDARLQKIPTDRGLNGASPLSRAFLEFTFKAEYAYDYGMPQWLARVDHLFSPFHFERLFLGRHKFVHFRVWYRDQLAKYVKEMLLDRQSLSRPYLDRKGVESMVRGHTTGNRNYTAEIHKLLTLEYVHRLFVDAR